MQREERPVIFAIRRGTPLVTCVMPLKTPGAPRET
jgi:hypothetical protein